MDGSIISPLEPKKRNCFQCLLIFGGWITIDVLREKCDFASNSSDPLTKKSVGNIMGIYIHWRKKNAENR